MELNERAGLDANFPIVNDQEVEDAEEELEDHKRREEEMYDLLTNGLGEFNQSTINSSIISYDGQASILPAQTEAALDVQYRDAGADDQLKVLYEVRVREVVALNNEIGRLNEEYGRKEEILRKKLVLLESHNQQKNISLKEAQDLLVAKVEHIKALNKDVENMRATIKHMESSNIEMNQENMFLRESNAKLEQQLMVMERGFPLQNKISHKELEESLKTKIAELESALAAAIQQNEQKDRQTKEIISELKQNLQEQNDNLMAKCDLVDELTKNYETTQNKCQELLRTIDDLQSNQSDRTESALNEELRKIREHSERTDVLCENVRRAVSEEFHAQISTLNAENESLKKEISRQKNKCEEIQGQLSVIGTIEAEKDALQNKLKELQSKFEQINSDREALTQKLKSCDSIKNVRRENEELRNKIVELESHLRTLTEGSTADESIQTSFSFQNADDIANLRKENENIYSRLVSECNVRAELEGKVELVLQENAQLQIKVGLEQERQALIKKLQEKAAEFEKIIIERQKELNRCETVSVGVNTDHHEERSSILRLQYDTFLYQTEAKLRTQLRQEFEAKLEKSLAAQYKWYVCKNCDCLKSEIEKLQGLRLQDRETVSKMVDDWERRFHELEEEAQRNLNEQKAIYEANLILAAKELQCNYTARSAKMDQHVKNTLADIELKREIFVKIELQRQSVLEEKITTILAKIRESNEEMLAVERKYSDGIAVEKKN